jgi:hypothetical protein
MGFKVVNANTTLFSINSTLAGTGDRMVVTDASGNLKTSSISAGSYDTVLNPSLAMPSTVGGFTAGTTVADVEGKTFISMFDDLLFPTVQPYIGSNASIVLDGVTIQTVEVGTIITPTSIATYNPGLIRNGDDSSGPQLKGNATEFRFLLPNGTTDYTDSSPSGNASTHTFTPWVTTLNTNRWRVYTDYATGVGIGIYYTNKNVVSTILDGSRGAGTIDNYSNTVTSRYYFFYGMGVQNSHPIISSGVRTLSKTFLGSSNNISNFNISIPAGTQEVYFYTVAGKNVTVLYVESSLADVTESFTETSMTVNDAYGSGVSYERWVSYIGAGGYPSTITYRVTVS